MSTDLKSRTTDVSLTRFWGGLRGACVQVTMPRTTKLDPTDQFFTSLQLTREQALTLARDLLDFACEDEQEQLAEPTTDEVYQDFLSFWADWDGDNALEEEF